MSRWRYWIRPPSLGASSPLDYELFGYWFCQTPGTPTELFGSYLTTGGSRNWSSYTNFAVDTAYLDMAGTMDPALRRQKALDLEDLILADMPIAPLPVQDSFRSSWSYVQDVPMGITRYMDEKLERVWLGAGAPIPPMPTPTPTPTLPPTPAPTATPTPAPAPGLSPTWTPPGAWR